MSRLPDRAHAARAVAVALLLTLAACTPRLVLAQAAEPKPAAAALPAPGDETLLRAREALRVRDRARLAAARDELVAARHPLAVWADYWELGLRLDQARQADLDAFYARWPGSYLEDRLRNDWLLELGRRRDWASFRAEFPRFRLNDDREVSCYALLVRHLDGESGQPGWRDAALQAWAAARDGEEACTLLGRSAVQDRALGADEAWQVARLAAEAGRLRSARTAAGIAAAGAAPAATAKGGLRNAEAAEGAVAELWRDPARFVNHPAAVKRQRELAVLGLIRLAAADPDAAAAQLDERWHAVLAPAQAADAWAQVARFAAMRAHPQALAWADRAWAARGQAERTGHAVAWSDETLAWQVRGALRAPARDAARWPAVVRAIAAMSPAERRDPAWIYWNARAGLALAAPGPEGEPAREVARRALRALAQPGASSGAHGAMGFYAKLAAEELGGRAALPPAPPPPAEPELAAARATPGLARALHLLALGLRGEGVREWNFTLRGLADRELRAAAAWACEREVWDRCINTSERTRDEIDMAQRFPTPHREAVQRRAAEAGLDAALVYGLIRQESRFVPDARSHVGASGLMQLMPATARWTAKKLGVDYRPDQIVDRELNLRLGMGYLRMVLDDFGGSAAMAAAAYNAGPGRPRRWREGPPVEAAAWAESIPFNETREYVKRVLSNAVDYALVLGATAPEATSLKARLGPPVGPRDPGAPAPDVQLP